MRHCWYVRSGCRQNGSYLETGLEEINGDLREEDFGPELVTVPSRWWYPCTALTIGDDSPNVRLGVGTHPRGNPVHSFN
jgi:hypothetical protein